MKTFLLFLCSAFLCLAALADQPGATRSTLTSCPSDTTDVWVNFLPYGTTWVMDSIVGGDSSDYDWRDTINIQVPVGSDYKGIYFVPRWVGGDSDSVHITARAIGNLSLLACAAGSQMQNVPLVNSTGSPKAYLSWTSNREYQSFVPDSVTTIEEFRPGACDFLQFVIESGPAHADSFVYYFEVIFKYGGGM